MPFSASEARPGLLWVRRISLRCPTRVFPPRFEARAGRAWTEQAITERCGRLHCVAWVRGLTAASVDLRLGRYAGFNTISQKIASTLMKAGQPSQNHARMTL